MTPALPERLMEPQGAGSRSVTVKSGTDGAYGRGCAFDRQAGLDPGRGSPFQADDAPVANLLEELRAAHGADTGLADHQHFAGSWGFVQTIGELELGDADRAGHVA